MATEDSAKPKDRASHGSSASTTTIAAPSTGSPADRRERLRPSSPIAPMAAARTTLGSGRARTTNPARATRARTGRARLGMPSSTHRPRTSPVTTATLLPLTAVRCVIPVARIASVRSAGVRLVSPMTRPGSNPRASAGAESTDARKPGPQPLRTRRHGPGRCDHLRCTGDGQRRDPVIRPLGGPQAAVHPHGGAPLERCEALVAGQQHRCADRPARTSGVEELDRAVAQDTRVVAPTGEDERVAGDDDHRGDCCTVGGKRLDPTSSAQGRVRRRGDLEEQHEHEGEHERPAERPGAPADTGRAPPLPRRPLPHRPPPGGPGPSARGSSPPRPRRARPVRGAAGRCGQAPGAHGPSALGPPVRAGAERERPGSRGGPAAGSWSAAAPAPGAGAVTA